MYILIPPSEGKSDAHGVTPFWEACPEWAHDVEPVLEYLRGLKAAEREKVYGVKGPEKAKAWHKANLAALDTPGLPAIERYTGVVYQHLDYPALRQKAAARKRLLITSAYFGLILAGTPIPNYKLPINPWLTKHWKPINTARLQELAKGKPVLNLLSKAYAKTIAYEPLISPDFRVAGGEKSAGHFGKAIKGKFVRFLIEQKVTDPRDFKRFQEDGYQWDGENFVQP